MQIPQQQQDLLTIFKSKKKASLHALMEYSDVIGEKLVVNQDQIENTGLPYHLKDELYGTISYKKQNYPSKPDHVKEEIGEFLQELEGTDRNTKNTVSELLTNNPVSVDLHRRIMALVGWPFIDLQMFVDYWLLKVNGRLNAQANGIDNSVRKQLLNPFEEELGAYTFGRKYDAMA